MTARHPHGPIPLVWLLSGSCNTNRGNKYPVKKFREKNFPEPALLGIMNAIQFRSYIAGLQEKFQEILTKIIFNNNNKKSTVRHTDWESYRKY